jgi:hypothetical protein
MQSAGLVVPYGAQAPLLAGQRRLSYPKVSHGARSVVFSARVPAKAPRSRSHRSAAVSVTASTASSNGNLLPWQAAMDEVKKRNDLKSIMIIGAGPIVIGQVRHLLVQEPSPSCTQGPTAAAHTHKRRFVWLHHDLAVACCVFGCGQGRSDCACRGYVQACEFDYSGTQACKALR